MNLNVLLLVSGGWSMLPLLTLCLLAVYILYKYLKRSIKKRRRMSKMQRSTIEKQADENSEKYNRTPDLTDNNPIVKFLKENRRKAVNISSPATANIEYCDIKLASIMLPELPDGYIDFLKVCDGCVFDGIELYGTANITIMNDDPIRIKSITNASDDFEKQFHKYFDDRILLCFGKKGGDYFTYDPKTGKYQVRSPERIQEADKEYDAFEAFFMNEVQSQRI